MRAKFPQPDGVVLVGKAQEKCTVNRTEKRYNPKTKRADAWIVKSTALVKQLERGQIAYQALDNGIRSTPDGCNKSVTVCRQPRLTLPLSTFLWQIEMSLTQVLDRPVSGRVFFE
jgi:hypothetical protein